MLKIRLATEDDAEPIVEIYAPIVRDTIISFELEPPSLDEMRQRISKTLEKYPWLICERDGQVLGYVYATKHRERAAYQWAVDVSAYVHPQGRRLGIGKALYTALFGVLRLQGFYRAYAGIALPNEASVGLHEAVGFELIGVYRQTGYKLGAWHDVGWWQLSLQPPADMPGPPLDLSSVNGSADWEIVLGNGSALLHP